LRTYRDSEGNLRWVSKTGALTGFRVVSPAVQARMSRYARQRIPAPPLFLPTTCGVVGFAEWCTLVDMYPGLLHRPTARLLSEAD
jgi:hypothetical protein